MKFRLFISSVQKEFARERREIARYVRKDALFGKFFDVFLFEETPAGSGPAQGVYLKEAADYRAIFKPHTSLPPNELIAGPMYLKGYIERLGTGTEDVAKLCAKSGLPAPGFAEGVDFRAVLKRKRLGGVADSGVEIGAKTDAKTGGTLNGALNGTLQTSSAASSGDKNLPENLSEVLTETAKRFFMLLSGNGKYTYDRLASAVGVTRETVRVSIRSLVAAGAIRRIGPDKGGHWEVCPQTPPRHPKSPLSPRSPKSPVPKSP